MKWMGFAQAMFEDNYPASQGDCYSLKKVFSGSGFKSKNMDIAPNMIHAFYAKNNIETYTTLPLLCKVQKTRWGNEWDNINHPTDPAVLSMKKIKEYPIIEKEADGYTWICYVKLKE